MVKRNISLKQLQKAIDRQRSRVNELERREKLEKELRNLKRSGRTDFAGRIGRGFVILSKKAGKVAIKQGRLIRERQMIEAKRSKKRSSTNTDSIFTPLDF